MAVPSSEHSHQNRGFTHKTSSQRYLKSNGLPERTVQIVKNIIRKKKDSGDDPQMGYLVYRSTQMLMGLLIHLQLPIKNELLKT